MTTTTTTTTAHRSVPSRLIAAINRWLFTPAPADDLGLARIVFFALALAYFGLWMDYADRGALSALHWNPVDPWDRLGIPRLSEAMIQIMEHAWTIAMITACIGFLTRASVAVVAILGFYLLMLPSNFSKVGHAQQLPFLAMLIFAFSRCGDAWSIDAWLGSRRRRNGDVQPRTSGEYRWPIRLIWLVFCLTFFASGISKLIRVGPSWGSAEYMSNFIKIAFYNPDNPPLPLAMWVAEQWWLCLLIGVSTLVLECGAPLALVNRKLRILLVGGLFGMQVGIAVLMGIRIFLWSYAPVYALWVPWGVLYRRVVVRRRQGEALRVTSSAADPFLLGDEGALR